jgi:NAD(P)H-nitrite reductase large subunit
VEAEIAFNVLPVFGVPATFIGATAGSTPGGAEVVAWGGNDAARGVYRRLVVRDGKLTAAAMVGPWRDAGLLRHVIETGMEVDRELTAALVAGSGWGKVKGHLLPRLRPRR